MASSDDGYSSSQSARRAREAGGFDSPPFGSPPGWDGAMDYYERVMVGSDGKNSAQRGYGADFS